MFLTQDDFSVVSSSTSNIKIYAFTCGDAIVKTELLLTNTRVGTKMCAPVTFFLIKHDNAWVAFDTGNRVSVAKDPVAAIGNELATHFHLRMVEDDEFRVQIKKLGLKPKDLKAVIFSHHHFDHAGAIENFLDTGVPLYFQKCEIDSVKEAQASSGYKTWTALDDPEAIKRLNIQVVDGIFDVFGDQTVIAFPMPGHTVGLQALLVKLGDGKDVVLASDSVHTTENLEKNIQPEFVADSTMQQHAYNVYKVMKIMGAEIVPSHDFDYFKRKQMAPTPLF